MTPVEQAAQVLAFVDGHGRSHWSDKHGWWYVGCTCGWRGTDGHLSPEQWKQHRAQALADAGLLHDPDALNRARAEGAAEALRAAAQDVDNHILGGASYHLTYWLRDRADRLEAEADR